MKLIDRLKELEAKATPGLWDIRFDGSLGWGPFAPKFNGPMGSFKTREENAELIVEVRNALRKLLAFVDVFDSYAFDLKDKNFKHLAKARRALDEEGGVMKPKAAMIDVTEDGARYNGRMYEAATEMNTVLFKDEGDIEDCLMIFVSNQDDQRLVFQVDKEDAVSLMASLQELMR